MNGIEEEEDRRRGGKTIHELKRGQGWTLSFPLRQLRIGQDGEG